VDAVNSIRSNTVVRGHTGLPGRPQEVA